MKRRIILMLVATLASGLAPVAVTRSYGDIAPVSPEAACAAFSGASSGSGYSCCMNVIRQHCQSYCLMASYCKKIPIFQINRECTETLDTNWEVGCKPVLEKQCGGAK